MLSAVALDFETELFRQGCMAPRPVSLALVKRRQGPQLHHCGLDNGYGLDQLATWLRWAEAADDRRIVGANLPYDMGVLLEARPDLLELVFQLYDLGRMSDVIIRQKLLDIALGERRGSEAPDGTWVKHGYSLASISARLGGPQLSGKKSDDEGEALRMRFGELRDVPLEQWGQEFIDYALGDGIATMFSWERQQELVDQDSSDVLADEAARCRADFALHLASCWGLRTDRAGVERLRQGCLDEMAKIKEGLLKVGLVRKDGTRNTRLAQQRLLNAAQTEGREVKLTKGGIKARADNLPLEVKHVATDEESCRDSGDVLLIDYAEYQTVSSLLTGHVKAMATGVTHPIHTHFDVLMETGRTSSSKPNVQNVRRAVGARECFTPREGWGYVGCDYDKAELHTLSQVCIWAVGRSRLADALNAGLDPHLELGGKMAGLHYDVAKQRLANDDAEVAEWRQRAKPANFGYPGGMGVRGMMGYAKAQYGILLEKPVAEGLREGFFSSWPEVSDFHGWVKHLLGPDGEGTIKHFVSNRYRGRVWFTAASNSFFQGLAADMALAAAWAVSRACYVRGVDDRLYSCRIVNFVHDELILEVPLERVHEAAEALREIMMSTSRRYVPDVPARASAVAMSRWSKKAKAVRKDGILQLWRYAA